MSLFLFLLNPVQSSAQEDLISKAHLLKLGQDPFWLKLLRFERSFFGFYQLKSAVRSKDFFLSTSGHENAQAELEANLEGLQKSFEHIDPNTHALCRFPARYKWLKKKLNWEGRDSDLEKCAKYKVWSKGGRVQSISLYFATGYFGNPASYFGHPLLKFNTNLPTSQFMDAALNYGALTPENENPIPYVLKGLFGGYTASFSDLHFFFHSHNYSEVELRDMWEYKLNFTPDEIQFVVDHTWELLGKKFSYYFLADNCALRMAELLEIAYDEELIPRNHLYAIPITMFESLGNNNRKDGRPLVYSVLRVPSRQSRLNEGYLKLDKNLRKFVRQTIEDPSLLSTASFENLSASEKSKSLKTLMDYYSYRIVSERDNQGYKEDRRKVLLKQMSLPIEAVQAHDPKESKLPPNKGQNSFTLRFGHVTDDAAENFQEFTIRPALYDELTPTVARPDNTSLIVFNTRLAFRDGEVDLRQMDIFSLGTFNVAKTDLPGENSLSWRTNLGLYSQRQDCWDCLVLRFAGGLGKSFELLKGVSVYGLLAGQAQSDWRNYGQLASTPEVGLFVRLSRAVKLKASFVKEKFYDGQELSQDIYNVESRWGWSRNWDLRLSYQEKEVKRYRATIAWYL